MNVGDILAYRQLGYTPRLGALITKVIGEVGNPKVSQKDFDEVGKSNGYLQLKTFQLESFQLKGFPNYTSSWKPLSQLERFRWSWKYQWISLQLKTFQLASFQLSGFSNYTFTVYH